MVARLEYHSPVKQLISATVAAFALMVFLAPSPATAQINGVPASVSSFGFGGHFTSVPGVPASVTSLGPNGFHGKSQLFIPPVGARPNPSPFNHRHHHNFVGGLGYGYPYAPVIMEQPAEEEAVQQDEYQGGPTIFDRRGSGQYTRPDEHYTERETRPGPAAQADAPAEEQTPTVLVFKDGHQEEVANYAIVGSTLYDFTAAPRRKIALADLDLSATAKQNDDRGTDFQLPAGSAAN